MPVTPLSVTDAQLLQHDVDALKSKPGALLPILHAVQNRFGYIPPAAVPIIAAALRQSRADVHGVISFYSDFRQQPSGAHIIQVCRAEACQAVGARALENHAKATLAVDFHQTTPDRQLTLEPVYCLGNCACGPSLKVGDRIYGRVSPEVFDDIVSELRVQVVEVREAK